MDGDPGTTVTRGGVLLVILVVACLAVGMALGPGRALKPPGTFLKYVEAARSGDTSRLQDYSPLYLAFVRGLDPRIGISGIRAVQVGLFALTCVAAALAVLLESGLWAALSAGLLAATSRPLLVYVPVLEPETLLLALLALVLAAGSWARRGGERYGAGSGVTAVLTVVMAGASGLAALVRPQYLLLVPLAALWVGWRSGRSFRWGQVVPALVVGALVVAPAGLHRAAVAGSVTVMSPGTVFYEGNGPQSPTGRYTVPEIVRELQARERGGADRAHVIYRRVAAASTGKAAGAGPASRYWASLALRGMAAEPRRAVGRFLSKAMLALAPYEFHDLLNAEDLDRRLRVFLPWGFGLLLAAAVSVFPGIVARRGPAGGALLVAALALAVQVAFYPSARQRLPLALALVVLWGVGVGAGKGGGRVRKILMPMLALAVWAGAAWAGAADAAGHSAWLGTRLGGEPRTVGSRLAAVLDGRALRPAAAAAARAVERAQDLLERGAAPPVPAPPELVRAALGEGAVPWWLRARAAWHVARSHAVAGEMEEALRWVERARRLDPEFLPAAALAHALRSRECPATPFRPPAGYDPLDAAFVAAREAALVHGSSCGRRMGVKVLRRFPVLRGALVRPWRS